MVQLKLSYNFSSLEKSPGLSKQLYLFKVTLGIKNNVQNYI